MNIRNIFYAFLIAIAMLSFLGCVATTNQQPSSPAIQEKELTVGVVQKEIHVGMSQADVAAALGSPNIVTKDSKDMETWVYDRIASEASYSKDSSGAYLFLVIAGGNRSKETAKTTTTQKTLTVIIKFDNNKKVESFSYHASKF